MLIDKLLGSSGKIGLEIEPEDLAGQLVGVLQQGTELTDQLFVGPIILVTEKVRQQADGFDLTFHFPCFWARHSQSKARKKKDTPSISGSILSNLFNKILLVQSHHVIYRLQRYDKNLKHPDVSRKIAKSGQNQRLRTNTH